jgi:AraC-like DNA-binding protein
MTILSVPSDNISALHRHGTGIAKHGTLWRRIAMNDVKDNQNEHLCDRVEEYILTCDIEELGVLTEKRIAEALDVNPSELIRKFARHQRIALNRFLVRERIHRAVFMLEKDRSIPVASLSEKLGFSRTDEFVMEFKNYVAVHPNKYRELMEQQ